MMLVLVMMKMMMMRMPMPKFLLVSPRIYVKKLI